MSERRCLLCNKPYNYKYKMFGRGCLDNLYELLELSKPPRIIRNKEMYLCTRIAWRNHKFFLSRNKKYELTKKYIAFTYLSKMSCDSLTEIKENLDKDISLISTFSKNNIDTSYPFSLHETYRAFNYSLRFNKIINDFKNRNFEDIDEEIAKAFLESISFIFDTTKKKDPILHAVFYSMQYTFWQVVVVGGFLSKKKLSAKLLFHSLSLLGKDPEDLLIEDAETAELIKESKAFKNIIKDLTEKYGTETGKFDLKDYEKEGILIRFEGGDLLYALHDATIFVKASKNKNNTWKLEVEIDDIYDFKDFKDLKEYADNNGNETEAVLTDIFSTLLNNFGVVSSEYGVIKTYDVKIKFYLDNYTVEY